MWLSMWGLGGADHVVVSGRRVWMAWIGMVTILFAVYYMAGYTCQSPMRMFV